MRNIILFAVCAVMFAAVAVRSDFAEARETKKVVIHLQEDDLSAQNQAFAFIRNMSDHYAEYDIDVEFKVIAIGQGLKLLRIDTSTFPDSVLNYPQDYNVEFLACGNTMYGMRKMEGLDEIDLIDGVRVVQVGGAALIELQEKGYAYIRP
ncbi:MAG: DsrE family protein [Pseudomonadota bacterium]